MSDTRWVFSADYSAHLLRRGAQPLGVVTARCGEEIRLRKGTIEHPVAPEGACGVCVQLHNHDLASEGIAALLADQEAGLTDSQRQALNELLLDLAARMPPDG